MTSIPARNGTLGPTLESLKAQTLQPDEIRLYIDVFCKDPQIVDVDVWRSTDRGPLTKLLAVTDARLPSDAIIVTVDDDVIYEPTWLETLTHAAIEQPDAAIGMSGWCAFDFFQRGKSGSYAWPKELPATVDVLEGWAGVVYRKRFFDLNLWAYPQEFRYVDDVWIGSYLAHRGIVRRVIRTPMAKPIEHNLDALHKRPDFVDLNRRAVLKGFDDE